MQAVLAIVPVAVVLVLMLGARWSAASAGVLAALVALGIAVGGYEFGGPDDPFGLVGGVTGVLAEAGFISATVIAIIGPALGIHHLQRRTGATDRLQRALATLTPDPRVAALLIAWFFALFMEGAAGFGTPVALAAPFLVAAGFTPVMAVTAAMVGHAAGVSFGAVGTPVAAQVGITGLPGTELAAATAPYHVALGWVLVAVVVVTISRAMPGERLWPWGVLAGVSFFAPFWLIAATIGPELPTLGGALVGAIVFVGVRTAVQRRRATATLRTAEPAGDEPAGDEPATMSTGAAAAPYLTLIGLVLATRLVPPIDEALSGVEVTWEMAGGFAGSVRPLTHPGLLLTIGFLVGVNVQHAGVRAARDAFWGATRQLVPVVVALLAMVTIARTMSQAGMTEELALTAAGAGTAWPLLSPVVGALGTFVTGSATASNILFTELQQETALASDLDVPTLVGAQGFGAAVGNIVCPHNVVAAAATVGLSGQEGAILRRTFPTALAYVVLGGALAWLLTR
ncbi:MAG: L-lactate permease [Ilumatobacteraceae bacterium]